MTFADEHGQLSKLPEPETRGDMSVEQAIGNRRSLRHYNGRLALADISQLLWAAQGETHSEGYRTAPSAGALYPLEVYLVAGDVAGLSAGIYRYRPDEHELIQLGATDLRRDLTSAAHGQSFMQTAAAVLVITGVYERTMKKYGKRGRRYVHMDAGHAAENVYLQAEARGLGTVIMGAFDDERVQAVLGMPDDHQPLGLMPVGPR
jgi:SagB-type dehydrogenase family enzyme